MDFLDGRLRVRVGMGREVGSEELGKTCAGDATVERYSIGMVMGNLSIPK
jgi:hypothetical protein